MPLLTVKANQMELMHTNIFCTATQKVAVTPTTKYQFELALMQRNGRVGLEANYSGVH